jgi:hypothetical protein
VGVGAARAGGLRHKGIRGRGVGLLPCCAAAGAWAVVGEGAEGGGMRGGGGGSRGIGAGRCWGVVGAGEAGAVAAGLLVGVAGIHDVILGRLILLEG